MLRSDNIAAMIGTTAYDSEGQKIGKVGQVYVDATDGRPSFASVHTGLFGRHESFVPIEQAEWEGGDDMRVPYTKEAIRGAPRVDAEGALDPADEAQLYRYYDLDGGSSDDDAGLLTDGDRDLDTSFDREGNTETDGTADGDTVGGKHAASGREVRIDRIDDADTGPTAGRHVDVGHAEPTAAPVAAAASDDSMIRSAERLSVGTERVPSSRVRLRKYTVTDQKTVTVPVTRAEVRVDFEPVGGTSDGHGIDGRSGADDGSVAEEQPQSDGGEARR
jgi:sporulation protein YlmC with PRC-barrel domain